MMRTGREPKRAAVGPGLALFPLRLFLGGTFVYAGIQKLSDPGFLHPGAPTYIGTQLQGFANGTPGGFILRAFALPHPVLAGVGVAIFEIFVGLLALAGLRTRLAAAAGLGLNLLLFLTASWHTTPYFLGPDLVFAFAWLPFVLAGAEGQPSLDGLLADPPPGLVRRTRLHPEAGGLASDAGAAAVTRRTLLAEFGAGTLAIAGIAALAKGSYSAPATSVAAHPAAAGGGGAGGGAPRPTAAAASRLPAGAVKLAPASRLPAGAGATYPDPQSGQPDIVIRMQDGSLVAYSAVCTHAGCTVGYSGGRIVCPCHGAVYDPRTGAVLAGPAPQGLAPRKVIQHGGELYAVPS